jgi:L-ascorbate metabolism protein UlaG (beta-lactamase superfamily)
MTPAKSDHFNGRQFVNLTGAAGQPFSAVPRMLRTPRTPWPARVEVVPQRPQALDSSAAVVTFVGHSTFLIQTAAGSILTDPMYSQRAGPFNLMGPRRVRQPAVRLEDLPPISIVLLSHNHYDHCDLRTLNLLARRFDPVVVTPVGNARLAQRAGLHRVEELDWWQSATLSKVPITLTPAHHFSARSPFDKNRALWGGFQITAGRTRIYFAGDTAYAPFFRDVRQRLGPIDLALLPIGAYEPRWFMRVVHMNPAEAVRAHLDLGARQSVAMHFGTFQLTAEGIDEPARDLTEALRSHGLSLSCFKTLAFGDSFRLEARE